MLGDVGGLAGSLHSFAAVFIKILMYNAAYNYITQAAYAYDDTTKTNNASSTKSIFYKFKFGTCKEMALNLRSVFGCENRCCSSKRDRLAFKALKEVKKEMAITRHIRLARITKYVLQQSLSSL